MHNEIRKRLYVLESRLLSVVATFEICRLFLLTEGNTENRKIFLCTKILIH